MRPTATLIVLAGLVAVAGIFVGLTGAGDGVWRFAVAVLAVVSCADVLRTRALDVLDIERALAASVPVNAESAVTLTIRHALGHRVRIAITERAPQHVLLKGLPADLTLRPGEIATVEYRLVPRRRGDLTFPRLDVLLRSPWGLWQVRRRAGETRTVRVYPDFSMLSGYLEMVSDRHLGRVGIKVAPRRGQGLEFHQLREFRRGDTLRQVDWKATSRRQTLISREYQEERDQHLLFLLDSGRRMRSRDGALSHFDHALNAMLLLAYVALRQGDSVAALAFGSESRWIPPQRGVASVNALLNAVYDLSTGTAASDYVVAAETVMARQRKRALVVLLTNLRESDHDLGSALELLRSRHVVLLANLRESALDRALATVPADFDEALLAAGAVEYQARRRERERVNERFAHLVLDTLPADLPAAVVNGYWAIKRAGAL